MKPLIFSLREVADWNNESPLNQVSIPALQCGLVWKPKQIELLWDSLMRGIPIGSFVVCEQIKSQKRDQADDAAYYLLDGQQRVNAIQLGFDAFSCEKEIRNPKKSILWLDIAPGSLPPESSRNFLFRVTTTAHPWGYTKSDDEGYLGAKVVRNWLKKNLQRETADNQYVRPRPEEMQPIEAEVPVPMALLFRAFDNGTVNRAKLVELISASQGSWQNKALEKLGAADFDLTKISRGIGTALNSRILALIHPENSLILRENASHPRIHIHNQESGDIYIGCSFTTAGFLSWREDTNSASVFQTKYNSKFKQDILALNPKRIIIVQPLAPRECTWWFLNFLLLFAEEAKTEKLYVTRLYRKLIPRNGFDLCYDSEFDMLRKKNAIIPVLYPGDHVITMLTQLLSSKVSRLRDKFIRQYYCNSDSSLLDFNLRENDLGQLFREHYIMYINSTITKFTIPHIKDGLTMAIRFPLVRRDLNYCENISGLACGAWGLGGTAFRKLYAFLYHAKIFKKSRAYHERILLDYEYHLPMVLFQDEKDTFGLKYSQKRKFEISPVMDELLGKCNINTCASVDLPFDLPFPLLLWEGCCGRLYEISCRIAPHNFNEIIDAMIAELRGEKWELFPDYQSGCEIDVRNYDNGNGVLLLYPKIKQDGSILRISHIPETVNVSHITALVPLAKIISKGRLTTASFVSPEAASRAHTVIVNDFAQRPLQLSTTVICNEKIFDTDTKTILRNRLACLLKNCGGDKATAEQWLVRLKEKFGKDYPRKSKLLGIAK